MIKKSRSINEIDEAIFKYLLLTLVAVIITFFTQFAALYGQPYVTQPNLDDICNTTAFYKPSLAPSHDSGLPIPYITHYVSDGGCGVGRPITWYVFILDVIIWLIVITILVKLVKYLIKTISS